MTTAPITTRKAESTPAMIHTVARRNVGAAGNRFSRLTVSYGLQKIGDQTPYFTVTGSGWYGRRQEPDLSGPIHDVIVAAFPRLADIIALHLSDVDGVPMHAKANGWYWYSDNDGRGVGHVSGSWALLTPLQRAENYLRAPGMFRPGLDRAEFDAHVEALRLTWLVQATDAISTHNLLTS
jgi:hypothetical protein